MFIAPADCGELVLGLFIFVVFLRLTNCPGAEKRPESLEAEFILVLGFVENNGRSLCIRLACADLADASLIMFTSKSLFSTAIVFNTGSLD
jgi:hypothetical protein